MNQVLHFFAKNPSLLFLLDGLGALTTAAMLFFVLPNLKEQFGMPAITLENLALIAFCFALYSNICFLFLKRNWSIYLRIIAYANFSYTLLTLFLLIALRAQITWLDWTYFLTEIVVILVLVLLELKTAKLLFVNR
jgi:hypothetical protein